MGGCGRSRNDSLVLVPATQWHAGPFTVSSANRDYDNTSLGSEHRVEPWGFEVKEEVILALRECAAQCSVVDGKDGPLYPPLPLQHPPT